MKSNRIIDRLRIPKAPSSIVKGASLKELLGDEAIACLAWNISLVLPNFDVKSFRAAALDGIDTLGLMDRGPHIARALRRFLPGRFDRAANVLLATLTPPLGQTEKNGLAVFFYHPHASFVSEYGIDPIHNEGTDAFDVAMNAQYELTKRFSAEFSIRPFLIHQQERTLARLTEWLADVNPHVRRLCSEGTRPRLPWGPRIPAFIADPSPTLPILEALKDDSCLYVRRSVANHLGDIAKDHLEIVLSLGERWLRDASREVKWVLRHALRHPAKLGNKLAIRLRSAAT